MRLRATEGAHDPARRLPLRPLPGGHAGVRHERVSLGVCAGTAEAFALTGRAPPCARRQPRRAHHVRSHGLRSSPPRWPTTGAPRSIRARSARCSPTPPSAMLWAAHLVLAAALVAVVAFGPSARWAATSLVSAALLASLGLVGHAAMQTGAEGALASREPRCPSHGRGRVDRRPRSVRDVPSRL